VKGAYGKYTFGNGLIMMQATDRVGGAVDSLIYNNVEFINAWDHGREITVLKIIINIWFCLWNTIFSKIFQEKIYIQILYDTILFALNPPFYILIVYSFLNLF
jgi:hypothetical protein